ncbi:MAG: hypothetical protein K2X35_05405 [Bryobacteraceae bacterium]|nr:hypothetical protein [Bryobacteraceae bacterium]
MAKETGERIYIRVGPTRYAVVIIPEPEPRSGALVIPFPHPAEKVQQKAEDTA